MATTLQALHDEQGQSPWLDDLKRSYLTTGKLQELVDLGIRGVTSNPTIMAKSIEEGSDYDAQFAEAIAGGSSIADLYWDLVLEDATGALGVFRPLFDRSGGGDGFVSVEVLPSLAHDTNGTISAARGLHERVNLPNLFVKIPATREGVPAIEEMIAEGRSINVTLIFSLERYGAVMDAYLTGVERFVASGGTPSGIASVASFFVSRVDTEVDRRLDAIAAEAPNSPKAKRALELRGRAALSQAQLAYELFLDRFSTPQAKALAAKGMRAQRPLWASTSTKNPAYPDLLYVEGLIGPDTVDTMPPATIDAFADHGKVARTLDVDFAGARAALAGLEEVGVDLTSVTDQLEAEGVAAFAGSFDELIERLTKKAETLTASR